MRRIFARPFSRRQLTETIGRRLSQFRRERGWDRPLLATKLEIPNSWIEEYERGLRLPPTYTLCRLAHVLGLSVGSLVDEEPAEMPLVNEELITLLRRLEELPLEDRRALTALLDSLVRGMEALRTQRR